MEHIISPDRSDTMVHRAQQSRAHFVLRTYIQFEFHSASQQHQTIYIIFVMRMFCDEAVKVTREDSACVRAQGHVLPMEIHKGTSTLYLVNVSVGEKEDRIMMTGMHSVVDLFCVTCGSIVGWKYEAAYEKSQKYKEGKFILERYKVLGPDGSEYIPPLEDVEDG
ncbi:hypothetical protein RYX36_029780 [Vicia faba]